MRRNDMTGKRRKALENIQKRRDKLDFGDWGCLKKSAAFRKGELDPDNKLDVACYRNWLGDQAKCLQEKLRGKP